MRSLTERLGSSTLPPLLLLLLQLFGCNTCVAVESWLGLRFTIVVLITVLRRLGVVGRAAMRGLVGVAAVNVALSPHSTSVAAPTSSSPAVAASVGSPHSLDVAVAVALAVSVSVVIVILFGDDFGESIFESQLLLLLQCLLLLLFLLQLLLLFVWGSAVSGNLQ